MDTYRGLRKTKRKMRISRGNRGKEKLGYLEGTKVDKKKDETI